MWEWNIQSKLSGPFSFLKTEKSSKIYDFLHSILHLIEIIFDVLV